MSVSTFTAAAAESALVAVRATLKATNSFNGLDEDLDRFVTRLSSELEVLVDMDFDRPEDVASGISSAVNYVMASVWIHHWPRRGHVVSFQSQDEERSAHLRRAQLIAFGAVLAAASISG